MAKVYCEDCRNFKDGDDCPNTLFNIPTQKLRETCLAPENFKDTYEEAETLPLSNPRIINRFNNCVWYIAIDEPSTSQNSSSSTAGCSFIVDMPQN